MSRSGLDDAAWRKLPLKLRKRWWRETDYGKHEPSDALRAEIAAAASREDDAMTDLGP